MTHAWMLCGALVAGLAAGARADTLKVPKDFATIPEALAAAQTGDEIVVAKGTYEPFVLSKAAGITLRGKGKPRIDGGGGAGALVTIDGCDGVELTGFRLQNGAGEGLVVTGSDDIILSKCRFEDIDGDALQLAGAGHLVEKCRFESIGGDAVALQAGSSAIALDKNRMTDVDTAVTFLGSLHVATKNRVKDAGNEGFVVTASECSIVKNRFDGVDDDALDVEGDDNLFELNRVKDANSNGVEIEPAKGDPFVVTGNVFLKNKVMHSGVNGFFAGTTGNTFEQNKAKKSGNFDLLDLTGPGGNTYTDNTFGTESIP